MHYVEGNTLTRRKSTYTSYMNLTNKNRNAIAYRTHAIHTRRNVVCLEIGFIPSSVNSIVIDIMI